MDKKARLLVLNEAVRWTVHILVEVQNNHSSMLSDGTQELLRTAIKSLEEAYWAVHKEAAQCDEKGA